MFSHMQNRDNSSLKKKDRYCFEGMKYILMKFIEKSTNFKRLEPKKHHLIGLKGPRYFKMQKAPNF